MNSASSAVLLAEGFEEIEAVTIVDVLRRADLSVVVAGITGNRSPVTGAHDLRLSVDADIADLHPDDLAMVVLPGGMPGAANLRDSQSVRDLVHAVWAAGGIAAAICAAPVALHAAGLLQGRKVTCYPSFAEELTGAEFTGDPVQIDERIVTGMGPGTALDFAFALVGLLEDASLVDQLRKAMLAGRPA